MPSKILPEVGLNDTDREAVRALGRDLTGDQALWVSGYFAGIADVKRHLGETGEGGAGLAGAGAAGTPADAAKTSLVKIVYGTETGNAAALAHEFAGRFAESGFVAEAVDMAAYKVRELKNEETLLFVVSTHGEGDPPEPAVPFFEFLSGTRAPKLENLRYAVLSLGDSTYEFFCEAGKRLDARLAELGATRIGDRRDCDVDYEDEAQAWAAGLLDQLAESGAVTGTVKETALSVAAPSEHGKKNPFPAPILENICITGRGSSKKIHHIEFDMEGSGFSHLPGDALGVVAHNDPVLVDELLDVLGWSGAEEVKTSSGPAEIRTLLTTQFEICALTPRFLDMWASVAARDDLTSLITGPDRKELTDYMHQRHVSDVIREGGPKDIDPAAFVAGLRGLQPRLYSLASSQAFAPDEAHLCVSPVSYDLNGSARHGVASTDLISRRQIGGTIGTYIQENAHFRLPADPATPVIMIGAGTGVAPYRAFLQEREAQGNTGPAWLFFGERNFRTDFLYQAEWQAWLKEGLLSKIDLAFSRDQDRKIYVQNRIDERARDLYRWIDDGAHLYVCGDATHMANDVHAALARVFVDEGGLSDEAAGEALRELQAAGRYQRDVY